VPIRFRCAYCNQLMGIARRKSGTVVRCPTCSGQVVVPNPDLESPSPHHEGEAPNLFERSDFDDVLRPPGGEEPAPHGGTVAAGAAAAAKVPAGAWGTQAEPMLPMERVDDVAVAAPAPMRPMAPLPVGGLVVPPGRLTTLAVIAALVLGLSFAAGVLVGKFIL
jgi:hypothetical protein